jgi:hypothetical protein
MLVNLSKDELLLIHRALLCYRFETTEIELNKPMVDEMKQHYQNITKVMDKVGQLFDACECQSQKQQEEIQ